MLSVESLSDERSESDHPCEAHKVSYSPNVIYYFSSKVPHIPDKTIKENEFFNADQD